MMVFRQIAIAATALFFFVAESGQAAGRLDDIPRPVVPDKVADRYVPARIDQTSLGGLFGERLRVNLEQRLLRDVDEKAILAGFQHRPGSHPWIGEHVGKFLHAATLMWAYSGDPKMRAKIDRVVRELIATQEKDGYLGTYSPDERFGLYPGADWDVWVHKYCLIGLLTYYRMTGYKPALEASRRVGDLLCRTFGDEPGKRDIISAGTHVGMAATSVLEPMVMLYRYTGEKRYLDFCYYIVRAYDHPNGPKIIRSLLEKKSVYRTANGKAYEMLSNLVGLCDLYRITGDERFVRPCLIAWDDVVKNRLYITGTASSAEHFKRTHFLPAGPGAHVGETCVTVTWIQFNLQLLRLFAEARFADELERSVYNHLFGAQHPSEAHFCYFTPLFGKKPYQGRRKISCCQSNGPRGVALIPLMTWGRRDGGVVVWLYTSGRTTVDLPDGNSAEIVSETDFPLSGKVTLTLRPRREAVFPVYLRAPKWCRRFRAQTQGAEGEAWGGGIVELRRKWREGDKIEIAMDMTVRLLDGAPTYPDFVAVQRGPQVLALDAAVNPDLRFLELAAPAATDPDALALRVLPPSDLPKNWTGKELFEIKGVVGGRKIENRPLNLVPFGDAGQLGTPFRVWLYKPDKIPRKAFALTAFGRESWSRRGNVEGSICDQMTDTFRVTWNGRPAKRDWFAVEMDEPAEIGRIVFAHGHSFHDGGWFDTSEGKPIIQVKRTRGGKWETVATLNSYPKTDAVHPPKIADGQAFEVRLPRPVRAVAVRIVGKPACGDNPDQAFSSCAELQAYGPGE